MTTKPLITYTLSLASLLALDACQQTTAKLPNYMSANTSFDWQGHRGARGLAPENSIPGFLKALEFPQITTLELDLAVSQDSQLIVSHEPWLSHEICSWPDGRPVSKADEDLLIIYHLRADDLARYDCGSRGHSRFPEQQKISTVKPTLQAAVQAVENWCRQHNRPLPAYNIEIKTRPEWDDLKTPVPEAFARLVVEEIQRLGIRKRACVQSFDVRSLQAVHRLDPQLTTALLVENNLGLEANLQILGYIPPIYSPNHQLVNAETVHLAHAKGMRIIPWTVNDTQDMKKLVDMGVDGIITDYPDRIPQ